MIEFSDEYRSYATKLITFSGIAFSLKIIPLQAVTFSDVTITLESRPIAIGLISFFVLYLLLNYVVLVLRDAGHQRLRDSEVFTKESVASPPLDLSSAPTPESVMSDWNLFLGRLHVGLDSILPALFAFFVVVLCRNELLTFFAHLWIAIVEGFSLPI